MKSHSHSHAIYREQLKWHAFSYSILISTKFATLVKYQEAFTSNDSNNRQNPFIAFVSYFVKTLLSNEPFQYMYAVAVAVWVFLPKQNIRLYIHRAQT